MDLLQNPFHILNATPRDNKHRIMELADGHSLLIDSSECMAARAVLTNPRKRLAAEIAWLPGLSPRNYAKVLAWLKKTSKAIPKHETLLALTPMTRANLLASGLASLSKHNVDDVAKWILAIAWAYEDIDPEKLRVIINEERIVSGFPEVSDLSTVEAEIKERRHHYRQIIKAALDNLSPKELVEAVTVAVESATDHGEKHGPILIADLVDSYEVEAQGFLDKEEGNIKALVEKLRAAVDAERPDSTLSTLVNQLIQVVKNWDTVAQPIQVSTKSRGLDHDASRRIAGLVRGLAIHMFNEHGKLDFSTKLTNMLQEVFAEVMEVAEQLAEDACALDDVAEQRKINYLVSPISDLCKTAFENSEKEPSSADKETQRVIDAAPQLVANLIASKPSIEILSQGKEKIALTLMHCAVFYGNETKEWEPCVSFLEEALKYAISQEVSSRIQKNLSTVKENVRLYGDLSPISSAPSLYTVNGIGTKLYGSSDYDPVSGSYLSTYCFVFFAIPIIPICRYRVIPIPGGYRFLGKAPLRTFEKIPLFVLMVLLVSFILSKIY